MTQSIDQQSMRSRWALGGIWFAGAVVAVELLIISLIYQHNFEFVCRDTAPVWFCAFAGRIVPRVLGVLAALTLFFVARRRVLGDLFARRVPVGPGLRVNLLGFVLILLPWFFLQGVDAPGLVATGAALWIVGGLLAGAGALMMLSSAQRWRAFARAHALTIAALLAVGIMLPELSDWIQKLWRNEALTTFTFNAVVSVLEAAGYDVYADPPNKVIGAQDFFVAVGRQCSGVEGFALITVFLTIYVALFREDLRFPNVLLLFPVGIALSWTFNVLRISILLAVGIEVSPELAIGAFHSHAGWVAFTALSLGLIAVSRAIPFFRRGVSAAKGHGASASGLPPFFDDPVVAQIMPFAIFMFTALMASTVSETPGVFYPWRVLLVAATLWLVRKPILALAWRIDPLALVSGIVIGAAWLLTSPPPGDGPPPFGDLVGFAFVIWVVTRVVGTVVLVPVLEELMFRGYLVDRIAPSRSGVRMAVAIAVGAVLFALLHDRWLAAGLAGVVFGLLVWRSGKVTDAIVSHAAANGIIAAWALTMGAWHVI